MEASEGVVTLVSIATGGAVWGLWLRRLFGVSPLVAKPGGAWLVPSSLGASLLDSRRSGGSPAPSMYDNRWLVVPQDFPSGRMAGTA